MEELQLPSGCIITHPLDRLLGFCAEEYDLCDAVSDPTPEHVSPLDVAITVAVTARVDTAVKFRSVTRGLAAACDPLLAEIRVDARLEDEDGPERVTRLIDAAVVVRWVLVPVATKVLHRKRPALVPMLDQVVLDYYLDATGNAKLRSSTQDSRRAAATAAVVLGHLRRDLTECAQELNELRADLAAVGFASERLRILDILVWTEVERSGYYR